MVIMGYGGAMDERWDLLFADLEAMAAPSLDEDEIPDLVEAERVSVLLADRLAGVTGHAVDLTTVTGARIVGTLRENAPDWVAIVSGPVLHVVPRTAIRWVRALEGPSQPATGVVRIGLAAIVRRLARSGLPVLADLAGTTVRGTIAAVGADHCDLATDAGVLTVPLDRLDGLRCDAGALGTA